MRSWSWIIQTIVIKFVSSSLIGTEINGYAYIPFCQMGIMVFTYQLIVDEQTDLTALCFNRKQIRRKAIDS